MYPHSSSVRPARFVLAALLLAGLPAAAGTGVRADRHAGPRATGRIGAGAPSRARRRRNADRSVRGPGPIPSVARPCASARPDAHDQRRLPVVVSEPRRVRGAEPGRAAESRLLPAPLRGGLRADGTRGRAAGGRPHVGGRAGVSRRLRDLLRRDVRLLQPGEVHRRIPPVAPDLARQRRGPQQDPGPLRLERGAAGLRGEPGRPPLSRGGAHHPDRGAGRAAPARRSPGSCCRSRSA